MVPQKWSVIEVDAILNRKSMEVTKIIKADVERILQTASVYSALIWKLGG